MDIRDKIIPQQIYWILIIALLVLSSLSPNFYLFLIISTSFLFLLRIRYSPFISVILFFFYYIIFQQQPTIFQLSFYTFLFLISLSKGKWYRKSKHLFEPLLAFFSFILFSPLYFFIGILIYSLEGKPVLYLQKRIGHNKKRFTLLKFRTMKQDAEKRKHLYKNQNESFYPAFKMKHDPRYYPFGKFLSHIGLDELPQLLNICKGDMSFVGYRPPLEEELSSYNKSHHTRFKGYPGLIGLWLFWDIHTFDDWIDADNYYAKNESFVLDLALILGVFILLFKRFFKEIV